MKYLLTHTNISCNPSYTKKPGFKKQVAPFFSIAQRLEALAVRSGRVSSLYANLFYTDMLDKEFALTNLKEGASVLHIGCGSYPCTALYLAQKGCRVDACDCNIEAVDKAQALVAKEGYSSKIMLFPKNGKCIDCSTYDAVWISLNVCPKEDIIFQALKRIKPGGKLIYRNNPLWLEKALFKSSQVNVEGKYPFNAKKAVSRLGAESVVIEKIITDQAGVVDEDSCTGSGNDGKKDCFQQGAGFTLLQDIS